ncbi:Z-ring formation inhibitor MciZ [Paenibacillus thailandensis]|uniref:Z-ring formation inhibitor MciZ n=1 Tax=Paenibacillus thailandensis TaxID=393250 RepID=A0ABW5R0Q1_9BACL
MKMYVTDSQLRLVGKAWEIRHQLNKLAAQSNGIADKPVKASVRKLPVKP